jgi:hypothetical protein
MFIITEVLRIKWQPFPTQHTIKLKQPDKGKIFDYLYKLVPNDARYIGEIKSSTVMSKTALEKYNTSTQELEEETVMCYIWSIFV